MKLVRRRYQDNDDYWHIRAFLREVLQSKDGPGFGWPVYRFDYWRWHLIENLQQCRISEVVFIWQTEEGRIAAVLHPEGKGEVFLQRYPALRSSELENEMLLVAEKHLADEGPDGGRKLCVWVNEHDDLCQAILQGRGYTKIGGPEYQRRWTMAAAIPDVEVAEGYKVRALGGVEELAARSWVSWKAFHPDEPDDAYEGWEWYHNIQRAPLYRRDLDIVAVAPDGEFASFCTVWFDDVTRTGAFEPVGTAPAHRRRGLGKAVMFEGLRRLRCLGATTATVGAYSPHANGLYAAVGFTEYDLSEAWVKEW